MGLFAEATHDPPDDDVLVGRYVDGDRGAFDEIVRRYQRLVFFVARRYVRDNDTARDVTQRTFVKAFHGLRGLRAVASLRAWLLRIAVNLALNHLREQGRMQPVADAGIDIAVEAVGATRLNEAEERGRLRAAITRLPPKQRMVLELRIFDELPFCEVADVAGCSENAAKGSFHLALRRLRELLEGGKS